MASFGCYLATILALWLASLQAQAPTYNRRLSEGSARPAAWLTPALCGSPGAILVLLGFVVGPLMPLEPRDVCERFMAASSESRMKQYATMNLWLAIHEMARQSGTGESVHWELGGEELAPADVGGYLVGHRFLVGGSERSKLKQTIPRVTVLKAID